MLRSYNAHNDYVLNRTAFNSLHEEFYNKQVYDMLDELQVSTSIALLRSGRGFIVGGAS